MHNITELSHSRTIRRSTLTSRIRTNSSTNNVYIRNVLNIPRTYKVYGKEGLLKLSNHLAIV